jgi:hypothetical protein
MPIHLYVGPMDAVLVDFGDDGQIRFENEAWHSPSLQERRAIIYAARDEIARLTELVETLDSSSGQPRGER